ncbi:ORF28 [Ictalurid herpesvirus 1]|nr:ORF28 [Ictalurid herpesvirus 1]
MSLPGGRGTVKIETRERIWVRRVNGETGVYDTRAGSFETVSCQEFEAAADTVPSVPVFCDRCFGTSLYEVPLTGFGTFVVGTCCIFSPGDPVDDPSIPAHMRKYQQPIEAHQTMVQVAPGTLKYSHQIPMGKVLGYWHVHMEDRVYLNMIGGIDESEDTGKRCVETFTEADIPCALSLGTLDVGLNEVILECSVVVIPARRGCHAKLFTRDTVSDGLEKFCFQSHATLPPTLLASFGSTSEPPERKTFYEAHVDALNNYIKLLRTIYSHKGETEIEQYLIEGSKLYSELIGEPSRVLDATMKAAQIAEPQTHTGGADRQRPQRPDGIPYSIPDRFPMTGYPFAPQFCGDPGLTSHYNPFVPPQSFGQGYGPERVGGYYPQPPNPYVLPISYGQQPYPGHPQPHGHHQQRSGGGDLKAELIETLGLAPKTNAVQESLKSFISEILESELKNCGIKRAAGNIERSCDVDEEPPRTKRARPEPKTAVETIVRAPYGDFDSTALTTKIGQVSDTVEKLNKVIETLLTQSSAQPAPLSNPAQVAPVQPSLPQPVPEPLAPQEPPPPGTSAPTLEASLPQQKPVVSKGAFETLMNL